MFSSLSIYLWNVAMFLHLGAGSDTTGRKIHGRRTSEKNKDKKSESFISCCFLKTQIETETPPRLHPCYKIQPYCCRLSGRVTDWIQQSSGIRCWQQKLFSCFLSAGRKNRPCCYLHRCKLSDQTRRKESYLRRDLHTGAKFDWIKTVNEISKPSDGEGWRIRSRLGVCSSEETWEQHFAPATVLITRCDITTTINSVWVNQISS